MQKRMTGLDRIDMDFGDRCRNELGRFNLQITMIHKEDSYGLNKPGTQPEA